MSRRAPMTRGHGAHAADERRGTRHAHGRWRTAQEDAVADHNLPRHRNDALRNDALEDALFDPPEPSWRPEDPERPDEDLGRPGYRDPTGGGEQRDARRWDSDEE